MTQHSEVWRQYGGTDRPDPPASKSIVNHDLVADIARVVVSRLINSVPSAYSQYVEAEDIWRGNRSASPSWLDNVSLEKAIEDVTQDLSEEDDPPEELVAKAFPGNTTFVEVAVNCLETHLTAPNNKSESRSYFPALSSRRNEPALYWTRDQWLSDLWTSSRLILFSFMWKCQL